MRSGRSFFHAVQLGLALRRCFYSLCIYIHWKRNFQNLDPALDAIRGCFLVSAHITSFSARGDTLHYSLVTPFIHVFMGADAFQAFGEI